MSDRHEIETLLMLYAERIDVGDFAGVGELFAHATYRAQMGDTTNELRGADAVGTALQGMIRMYPVGGPRSKHLITNVVIDVDGDTAASRCYWTGLQQTDDLPLQPVSAGRYHDRFERVDGVWRFADRLVHTDLVGDLSHYLAAGPVGGGAA